jgi:hypothetical protein
VLSLNDIYKVPLTLLGEIVTTSWNYDFDNLGGALFSLLDLSSKKKDKSALGATSPGIAQTVCHASLT